MTNGCRPFPWYRRGTVQHGLEFATVPEMGCGPCRTSPCCVPPSWKLGTVLTPSQVRDRITSGLTGISTRGCVNSEVGEPRCSTRVRRWILPRISGVVFMCRQSWSWVAISRFLDFGEYSSEIMETFGDLIPACSSWLHNLLAR